MRWWLVGCGRAPAPRNCGLFSCFQGYSGTCQRHCSPRTWLRWRRRLRSPAFVVDGQVSQFHCLLLQSLCRESSRNAAWQRHVERSQQRSRASPAQAKPGSGSGQVSRYGPGCQGREVLRSVCYNFYIHFTTGTGLSSSSLVWLVLSCRLKDDSYPNSLWS